MQTNFTPEQLQDPQMAASEKILRTCVHCGFCTATCPTYLELGDELDSPRGRIYLMKEMFENDRPASPEIVRHIDRCLSCLSCMTTCPSGVHYMHLVDHGRAHIERTYRRPWHDRYLREALARILPYPGRFRAAIAAGLLGRLSLPVLKRARPLRRLAAMVEMAPSSLPPRRSERRPAIFEAQGRKRGRVAVLTGCAQPVLAPHINEAAIRIMNRAGIEVILPKGEGCCGALVHHMGREDEAVAFAKNDIDVWTREIEGEGLDAIVITASGCGTTIKDYGFMMREDPAYAEKAERVSALARDVSEYLAGLDLPAAQASADLAVAYHSACSMQHGQQIREEPKMLLRQAGFEVRDVPEGHICCGSAGTYNLLQPELAGRLRDRKVRNIEKVAPDVIATGNIGCMAQIGGGTRIPIVHTVELLDWAQGGPVPAALDGRLPPVRHAPAAAAE
ncbi:glycolate oxidase subunit GlcF [Lutibaculum baratangense]|uniref:Glycolate oxidase iron-sulfur subunit n=1 Tax=Lutibaculum baratangense AMV1 TaxID=631454 RepID=V4RK00_9HYPH|nr:glycolate oxidase subunit GlcF [Lutibaculum baratangense]ESR26376.1 Glycolate dehydrogenase, iron-sulfur subunit GlcF [Lutibaculum baratangense AMV1]